jgi:membrane protein
MLLQILELPLKIAKKFRSDRLLRHASALAFSSLLALAPMMAIGFAMLSMFSGFQQIAQGFEDFIFRFLVPTAGNDVRNYIEQFAGQAGKLTIIGLSLFLFTALLLLNTIEESFNDIWGVGQGRTLGQRLTVYWALVTLGPLLMGGSLTISTYLLSDSFFQAGALTGKAQIFGIALLPFIFQLLAFTLLYLVMPNVRVRFVDALSGAIVATLLFEATKRLFSLYIVHFDSYEVVYGALSTLPIFLIWIYLSWVVALIGAEVVSVLQQEKIFDEEEEETKGENSDDTEEGVIVDLNLKSIE